MDRYFLDVISGRRRGVAAAALRGGTALVEPVYRLAVRLRNQRFAWGVAHVVRTSVPVVSVGNITTGGTGKTPVVAWIVKWLAAAGRRPGILSRGYRSLDGAENDEKRLLDQLCPGAPHVQGADRAVGAARAIAAEGCDVLVLDDGFQHRRLARDLDIVLIDALCPWGYGRLLPRGLLREPPSSLARANLVVVTRADQRPENELVSLRDEIARYTPAEVIEGLFVPGGLINAVGDSLAIDAARGVRAAAFCGIGNPDGFRATLRGLGVTLSDDAFRAFPDHHHYTPHVFAEIGRWGHSQRAEMLLTTLKDLVKCPDATVAGIPLWGVEITFQPRPAEPLVLVLTKLTGFRES
jgi:tetraacyldisaccharide 4'-kinase